MARIVDGVGKDALRRAEKPHKSHDILNAKDGRHYADKDNGKKGGGGKAARLGIVARAEAYLYLTLRAAAKGVADGVKKGEDDKNDAGGGVCTGSKL